MARVAYAVSTAGSLLAVALRLLGADPSLTFAVAAIAILGLAYVLGEATEHLGAVLGPRAGGVLNATVGNIGEIIIAGFLIAAGELEVVKASITGSIIGNLLLVLGLSLLVGGVRNGIQRFDTRLTGMNAASLILATIGLVVPAMFALLVGAGAETGADERQFFSIEALSVGVAGLLLTIYGLSLVYQFMTPGATVPVSSQPADEAHRVWPWRLSLAVMAASAVALTVVSEILVHTIDPVVETLGISRFFLGIILIPFIGNLAEHVVGITLAYKNKMDFSLLTSIGSSTQIALFAAPVLVVFSLVIGQPLTLVFTTLEVTAVAVATLIAAYIAVDGESNWLEGAQLVSVYLILAIAFFFLT
ncbi:MAG: calcium/proton exchanger [Chloroflexota bacterium]|nr:calcium/proton exchanger [Chloroflexota bacterium]